MINQAIYSSIYEIIGSDEYLTSSSTMNFAEDKCFPNAISDIDFKQIFRGSQKELNFQFGELSIKGMMIRVGRSSFEYLLNNTDILSELTALEFRLLSRPKKIMVGLKLLSKILSSETGFNIKPDQDKDEWYLIIGEGTDNHRRPIDELIEVLYGFFQEFMYWASGGRSYRFQIMNGSGQNKNQKTIKIEKAI